MRKIEDYATLSALISAQLRRGMCTNAFASAEAYRAAIADGALRARSWEGGLLLLWDRGGFDRLSFWLTDPGGPIPLELTRPTVLEIACRPRDAALAALGPRFEALGFRPQLTRQRLTRPAAPPPDRAFHLAGAEELPAIAQLLAQSFPPLTGCLPTARELAADRFLTVHSGGTLAGVLHFSPGTIRHLAVRPEARRQGLGRALVEGYLCATGGPRSVVWTASDAACSLYRSCGFTPDGYRSGVWLNSQGGL